MAVIGELVQAGVGNQHGVVTHFAVHRSQSSVEDAVLGICGRAKCVFVVVDGDTKERNSAQPCGDSFVGLGFHRFQTVLDNPGK